MFVFCDWNEAKDALQPALGDYFNDAITEVLRKNELIIKIAKHSFALIRLENINNKIEMVIVGLAGEFKISVLALYKYGQTLNCYSMRCHTKRKGQIRLLNSMLIPTELVGIDEEGYFILRTIYGRFK